MAFYVYILASQRNGTLYIGQTDSISRRVWEHQQANVRGFTAKYGVKRLVHYGACESRETAFRRERAMKKWNRAWKLELIERFNPTWTDLADQLPPEWAAPRPAKPETPPEPFIPAKAGTQVFSCFRAPADARVCGGPLAMISPAARRCRRAGEDHQAGRDVQPGDPAQVAEVRPRSCRRASREGPLRARALARGPEQEQDAARSRSRERGETPRLCPQL